MRKLLGSSIAGLALVLTASCSSSGKSAQGPSDGSMVLNFPAITISPGEEDTECVVVRLGNAAAMHVGTIHDKLGDGSHHMIVYRVNDTEEQKEPFACKPFTDTLNPAKGQPLIVSQKKDDVLTLPPGVAFTLDANQMIRLELHYINPGSAPLTLEASTSFLPMADADFQNEAGFLFIGDADITLPPHAETTLGPVFFKAPADYSDVKFFAITGHEHSTGTGVTVQTATDAQSTVDDIYDVPGWLWSEPKTVQLDPPMTLPKDGGFQFTCKWNNTTDNKIGFGESALDEMCFFWAYYYPNKGAKVCIHTTQTKTPMDFCCPGADACKLVAAF